MMAAYPVTDMYKQSSRFGESGVSFDHRSKSLTQALRLNAVPIQEQQPVESSIAKSHNLKAPCRSA
jgi:hypothetical protein